MLKNFQVIEIISSKTKAAVTIYPDRLKFNKDTAPDLGNPSHIQFLIDPNGKNFAIVACSKDAENSVALYLRKENVKRYPLTLKCPAAVKMIRSTMGWTDDSVYHFVTGQKFIEENAIVFNLNDAEEHPIVTRSKNGGEDDESDDD